MYDQRAQSTNSKAMCCLKSYFYSFAKSAECIKHYRVKRHVDVKTTCFYVLKYCLSYDCKYKNEQ